MSCPTHLNFGLCFHIIFEIFKDGGMELVVEIADGLNVTVNRATIRDVVNEENFKPAKIETKPAKNKAAKPANSNAQEKRKK